MTLLLQMAIVLLVAVACGRLARQMGQARASFPAISMPNCGSIMGQEFKPLAGGGSPRRWGWGRSRGRGGA